MPVDLREAKIKDGGVAGGDPSGCRKEQALWGQRYRWLSNEVANDRPEVFGRLLGKVMLLQEKQLAKTKQEPAKPVAHMRKSPAALDRARLA